MGGRACVNGDREGENGRRAYAAFPLAGACSTPMARRARRDTMGSAMESISKKVAIMAPGNNALLCVSSSLALLLSTAAVASGASIYTDGIGDLKGGAGPDITRLALSNTATTVTFRLRFAKTPPLRASARNGWADMLLIGIDVPPLGAPPVTPGGEWPGSDFALGTHGPSRKGMMVKQANDVPAKSRNVATFKIATSGSTLTFSIPRRVLGRATSFRFMLATAREGEDETTTGGGVDLAPGRGTFRYVFTG
jgi:hypothetical protein